MHQIYRYRKSGFVFIDKSIITALIDGKIQELLKAPKMIERNYENFFDYYTDEHQLTHKTIHLSDYKEYNCDTSEEFRTKCTEYLGKMLDRIKQHVDVEKDESKSAMVIKTINKLSAEVDNLQKVNSQYVVQYMAWWFDDTRFYIRMELCSDSLQKILRLKPQVFGRQPGEPMNSIEFYISCHIFKEILECVQYLHELNPPIIHRDLKPDNILVAQEVKNNRYFKLCDFGLSTVHDRDFYTMTGQQSGAPVYQAPEVTSGRFDHRVDIYSLFKIGEKLFDFNMNDITPQTYSSDNEVLNKCVIKLREVLVSMSLSPNWEDRPECKDVLKTYHEWAIDEKYVAKDLVSLIPILWQNMKRLNNSEFFVKYFIANFGDLD
ncbi:unnamed protein product [Oppiella nova]|uniref:Protein kinase domain-containing protein n=1 Tax=Oppiella nova TaxID=334625 RepID=A0A7R9M6I1_9ACAR|nr:unnamed protein product [Oppiella nova]CAG2171693.1 unnamed protein product [Oppiella nova]